MWRGATGSVAVTPPIPWQNTGSVDPPISGICLENSASHPIGALDQSEYMPSPDFSRGVGYKAVSCGIIDLI